MSCSSALDADCASAVASAKVLMIGAGGIGCELLKNLVLVGFSNIDVIDLDTIDVSNLNRQFLFHKQHVGRSKAEVATESAKKFKPNANVNYFHNSIFSPEYNVSFFRQYSFVLNALDNRTLFFFGARNHVNRLCLAADIPLVESGSAGYLGQVSVIKKGEFECYECKAKPAQKTYPGCTIRNTPSEPIHCIVWAKHLFNQLFGEADIDEDVSPDREDPELENEGAAAKEDGVTNGVEKPTVERISTRKWAVDNNYDPNVLFNKMFHADIEYLLSMGNLWKKRRAPTPLVWDDLPKEHATSSAAAKNGNSAHTNKATIRDQAIWTPFECRDVFVRCVEVFREQLKQKEDGAVLIWDKDDDDACDFVTAVANLRSHIFGIALKSRFDVKSMAGNIIPAIATTNAVVAGMIVMEALKVINGQFDKCRSVFINRQPNPRGKILMDQVLDKPNPSCYVCSAKPEVIVKLNTTTWTIGQLEEKLLKGTLNMVAPDVQMGDATGTIIISSEEGEIEGLSKKYLHDMNIRDGAMLQCDDYMQQFELRLTILHSDEDMRDTGDFQLVTDTSDLKPLPAKETHEAVSDEDDVTEVQQDKEEHTSSMKAIAKRKLQESTLDEESAKKTKLC